MIQKAQRILSAEEMERIAIEFETHEFTPEELAKIARTRRSTPRPAPAKDRSASDGA